VPYFRELSRVLLPLIALAGCRGASPDPPNAALLVHWLGTVIWNDTVPHPNDSLECRALATTWTRRPPASTAEALDSSTEKSHCDQVFSGRRPRDSTQVLIAPGNRLARAYVAAARIPYRTAGGLPGCPWKRRTGLPEAGIALVIRYHPVSGDSVEIGVDRRCEGFSDLTTYYLVRTRGGWKVRTVLVAPPT
jgi:hypothetical protein